MSKVKFYLKEPKSNSKTLIFLVYRFKGQMLKYSTEEFIEPKLWNPKALRVKETKTFPESFQINMLLNLLEERVISFHRTLKMEGKPVTPAILKSLLKDSGQHPQLSGKNQFIEHFQEFIEHRRISHSKSTIFKYHTTLRHLKDFSKKYNIELSFDNIDLKFYDKIMAYFISDLGHLNNSIAKNIKMLKTFLNWATEREYNKKLEYLRFKTKEKDAQNIALSLDELMTLYNLNLSEDKILDKIRDLFCLGCLTGMRFSDIINLKKENLKENEIHIMVQKTKENLIIPLNDFTRQIINKYDGCLPIVKNVFMNKKLKVLAEMAGINESITLTRFSGSETVKIVKPKFMFVSSHTARRTFVTLSLEQGMRAEMVMSITGHTDYKSFKKYIKLTDKVKHIEMNRIWNINTN